MTGNCHVRFGRQGGRYNFLDLTIVTTFVTVIAKITILIFLLELVYYTGQSIFGFN